MTLAGEEGGGVGEGGRRGDEDEGRLHGGGGGWRAVDIIREGRTVLLLYRNVLALNRPSPGGGATGPTR